ncbi:hypothetical protein ACSBR1_019640 [Camellia fascicularis]
MRANKRCNKAKKKQSKFMICIRTPIRILNKAIDFYEKTLLDCAGKTSCRSVVCSVPQLLPHLPRNNNNNNHHVGLSNEIDNEDVRRLARVVSKRHTGREATMNIDLQQEEGEVAKGGNDGVGRSYSVGIGKIGRIDEDKPCEFEEEEEEDDVLEGKNTDLLKPRSKSYGVRRRRNIVYY